MLARGIRGVGLRAPQLRQAAPAARLLHATRAPLADEAPKAGGGMLLTFTLPKECLYKAKPCEMVMLPSVEGLFGVMQQHVPTIAELKPGVVSVQEIAGGPLVKYFISGGFAAINEKSELSVNTLIAVPIEDLEPEAIKAGLAQYMSAYAAATDDIAKSEAEIGMDCYQAMSYAIAEGH